MDVQILSSTNPTNIINGSGGFVLGSLFSFQSRQPLVIEPAATTKMVDSSLFSLDGLAEDEPDSALVCCAEEEEAEEEVS